MQSALFAFPDPVNEYAARLVAGGVFVMTVAVVFGGQHWVLVPLAYGFFARVLTGPKLSPLGSFVTRLAIPALGSPDKPVPGKPKRFAQGIGASLSAAALASWLLGSSTLATVCAALILFAASLEAFLGYCLGCVIYRRLAKLGIVPDACPECADISLRPIGRKGRSAHAS